MSQLARQIGSSRLPGRSRRRSPHVTSTSILEETQGQGSIFHGLAALFGDPSDQLAFSIFSLLPWLCLHYKHTPFTLTAQACIAVSKSTFIWLVGVTALACRAALCAIPACKSLALHTQGVLMARAIAFCDCCLVNARMNVNVASAYMGQFCKVNVVSGKLANNAAICCLIMPCCLKPAQEHGMKCRRCDLPVKD